MIAPGFRFMVGAHPNVVDRVKGDCVLVHADYGFTNAKGKYVHARAFWMPLADLLKRLPRPTFHANQDEGGIPSWEDRG